jgi:hypothetical protein
MDNEIEKKLAKAGFKEVKKANFSDPIYPVLNVQMVTGCDLIGAKMSIQSTRTVKVALWPAGQGFIAKSNGKLFYCPNTNVKGALLDPTTDLGSF